MIRPAGPGDAEAVRALALRAWRWAWTDVIGAEELLDAEPPAATWVWDQGGLVIGAAAVDGAELVLLCVDPPAQGAGVGSALLAHAQDAGARAAWVFVADGHARELLARRGWQPDGERREWLGATQLHLARPNGLGSVAHRHGMEPSARDGR